MKNRMISVFCISLLLLSCSGSVFAASSTLMDNYTGGNSDNPGNFASLEVIGEDPFYAVSHLNADLTGTVLTIDIYSRYLNNAGYHNTYLGDLFISNSSLNPNGWNPEGAQPWDTDVINGEDWEYVVNLDYNRYSEEVDPNNTLTPAGSATLYAVDENKIVTPDEQGIHTPSYYRAGQEIFYAPDGQNGVGGSFASWEIFGLGTTGTDTDDYLRFIVNFDLGVGLNDLAVHWSMTCANDIIEGSLASEVPEPVTMLLFGTGLASLAPYISRRKNKLK